jgi:transglutaminase-like putative cysteine protease
MVTISTAIHTLCTLIALLGYALLVPYLDPAALLALPLAVAAGIFGGLRRRALLPAPAATLLAIAVFFFYASRISLAAVTGPVVNLLILLLSVRLAAEKRGRDYLQICVLALFALAASSLLSLSPVFFAALVAQVILVSVALVLLCFHNEAPALALPRPLLRRILTTALALPLASLVLMFGFFVILPRTTHPLWNFLNPAAGNTAGFSETVAPGTVADFAGDPTLAFRVQTEELPPEDLYWRGIVLNTLEGGVWSRSSEIPRSQERVAGGRLLEQVIFLEPKSDPFLPGLDLPVTIREIPSSGSGDAVFRATSPPRRRVRYRVLSRPGGVFEPGSDIDRGIYLQMPEEISPRLRETARLLGREDESAAVKIARLEEFFRARHLTYATSDLPLSADPLDEFLFEKRRGYCEYFASSFALLLRLSGVPARLVGGYYGGTYNPLGGYYAVSESRAHVWVEALDDAGHWVRHDPTRFADNPILFPGAREGRGVRGLLDAAQFFWDRAVIGYDLDKQMELFGTANRSLRSLHFGKGTLAILAWISGGILFVWGIVAALPHLQATREERLLRRYLKTVEKRFGKETIRPGSGLEEIAGRTGDERCREFAAIYGGALYRDRPLEAEEQRRLATLVRALRRRE